MCQCDLEKAFDTIDCKSLWKILRHYGVPAKLVQVIAMLYSDFKSQVVCDTELTDPFHVSTGVKQGCILSPFLFILAMDWIMKTSTDSERRGIRWTMTMTTTTALEDLDFADDIALLSHRHQDMQEKTKAFSETAGNIGLKVSTKKTKSMRVNARVQDSIKLNGEEIEQVDSFTYLGSKMSNTGDAEVEIRAWPSPHSGAHGRQKTSARRSSRESSNASGAHLTSFGQTPSPTKNSTEELKPSPSPRRFNEGVGNGLDMCSASRQQTFPESPYDGLQTAEENEAAQRKLGEEQWKGR
ncbi:hypothetical protein C0Q70_03785 [Pomacea canaliculata]|uniref:Reverse transcriptase domain-containing protein n=1 Tax=Pomacea canaliculata TaxID=400727 RepID=A0A2T7PTP3_POMCA|nr:hypothetical protein C0Q70_03785 [Pomacea canaliculata]